jgi:hypothetical protein
MTSQTPDMQAVLERLVKLERHNRIVKGAALAIATLGAAALLVQARAKNTSALEAEKFSLKDASGHVRADLSELQDGTPVLKLYEANGNEGTEIMPGSVMLMDSNGRARLQLSVGADGSSLSLIDEKGAGRVVLDQGTSTNFLQPYGKSRVYIGAIGKGATLAVSDSDEFSSQLGTIQTGIGERQLSSAASLVLVGKGGNVIWRAP